MIVLAFDSNVLVSLHEERSFAHDVQNVHRNILYIKIPTLSYVLDTPNVRTYHRKAIIIHRKILRNMSNNIRRNSEFECRKDEIR